MAKINRVEVGHCIYCGLDSADAKLTNEHVVPYGLNGSLVLQKASCVDCAKITSAIERECLRGIFLEARTHLNMRTRRPKERPTTFPAFLKTAHELQRYDLPLPENPFLLRLPILAAPPILSGTSSEGLFAHKWPIFWTCIGKGKEGEFIKEYSYSPDAFCLLLAKIAHCSAIYWKGYKSFEAFLPQLIRSRSNDIADYVGGCENPHFPVKDGPAVLHIVTYRDYIIVEICLFPSFGAPSYQVVVGRPLNETLPQSDESY